MKNETPKIDEAFGHTFASLGVMHFGAGVKNQQDFENKKADESGEDEEGGVVAGLERGGEEVSESHRQDEPGGKGVDIVAVAERLGMPASCEEDAGNRHTAGQSTEQDDVTDLFHGPFEIFRFTEQGQIATTCALSAPTPISYMVAG